MGGGGWGGGVGNGRNLELGSSVVPWPAGGASLTAGGAGGEGS